MASPAQLFQRAQRFPLGDRLFSWMVTRRAPYFASIRPRFLRLEPGHCEVAMRNRRAVHNHMGTVNAIAMCALCEVAAGAMMESSVPRNLRWIPRGMTVRYLDKADTDLVVTVTLPRPPEEGETADIVLPARVRNTHGEVVMEADITMYVSPRRQG
jgi:acyl-coenzyme A thioesterase PaaI-like protein